MKKQILTIILLSIVLMIAGCNGQEVLPNDDPPFEEKLIEDKAIIADLWDSLLYDSIPSIGNSESFDTANDIEVTELAKFAYIKTVREKGYEALDVDTENRFIIDENQIEEVSSKYLNLEEVDFSGIESHSFIKDSNSFGFHFTPNEEIPKHDESNAWGIVLDSIKQIDENEYQAILRSYFDSNREYVQTEWIYKLTKEDSNWVIISMEKNFPDNNLINIEGNIDNYDQIENYPRNYNDDNMKLISVIDNKAYISSNLSIDGKFTNIFGIINLDNMEMEKYIDIGNSISGIKYSEDTFLVKKEKEALIVDMNLEITNSLSLPETIKSLIDRDIKYDDQYNSLTWYGGYDYDKDLSKVVYADEEGLKLLNIDDESVELLITTSKFPNDSLAPYGYYYDPKFVANDNKVLFKMAGYEGFREYLISDLSHQEPTYKLDIGSYSVFVSDKSGTRLMALDKEEGLVINLETRQTEYLNAEWPLSGYNEMQMTYVQNSSEWFAFTMNDYETNEVLIYKVDVNNGEILGPLAKVSTVIRNPQVDIIGIIGEGRVLCSYSLFLNESGYFLTK